MNIFKFEITSMAESIIRDGAGEVYVNASEEDRIKIMLAYFDEMTRKMNHIETIYATTPEARQAFVSTVLENVRNG